MAPKLPKGSDGTVVVQLRARITLDQYEGLRVLAIRQNRPTSDLVGAAITATYPNLTRQEATK